MLINNIMVLIANRFHFSPLSHIILHAYLPNRLTIIACGQTIFDSGISESQSHYQDKFFSAKYLYIYVHNVELKLEKQLCGGI